MRTWGGMEGMLLRKAAQNLLLNMHADASPTRPFVTKYILDIPLDSTNGRRAQAAEGKASRSAADKCGFQFH
ncbi:hypothetical protein ColLi_02278 [Colletotrichum liriopes]|uniref:Uncharacterized protein n=1 Tax=Colletotrichum liriopes TaxID=708192 RepID=A0AA37GF11_9PEZI|nr:hypothetical protein ColLi_02278 [Colletotrichum liriopes]